jgi:predicted nucleic acid-binding protein
VSGFLVDTNVISELVRPRPEARVKTWVASVDEDLLFLSVLTIGEIRKGIALLPDASRRVALEAWLDGHLAVRFDGRILPIDLRIAERWGRMAAQVAPKYQLPVIDGFLAATAVEHNLTFVTRNTKDVIATGVPVFNPWTA